jgi:hypothetical protein
MRFLQPKKFSYLIQEKLFGLKINSNKNIRFDLESNEDLYRKFLKATLIESFLTLIYLIILIYFAVQYLDFQANRKASIETKLENIEMLSNSPDLNVYIRLIWINLNSLKNDSFLRFKFVQNFTNLCSKQAQFMKNDSIEIRINSESKKLIEVLLSCSVEAFYKLTFNTILNSGKSKKIMSYLEYKYDRKSNTSNVKSINVGHFGIILQKKLNILSILIYILLTLYFLFEELFEMIIYLGKHFAYLLNLNDLISLICNISMIFFLTRDVIIVNYRLAKKDFKNLDYDQLNNDMQHLLDFISLNIFLIWTKLFKFYNFNTGVTQMNATLTRSFNYLFCYLIIFWCIFLTLGELMHRVFGQIISDHKSFIFSQFTLIKFLLADINASYLYNNDSYQIVFLLFFFLVFIILSSIFLAIVNDAYLYVIEKYDKKPELDYFNLFLRDFFKVRAFKLEENILSEKRTKKKNTLKLITELEQDNLNEALSSFKFKRILLKMNYDSIEIDSILRDYNIEENEMENDEDSLLDPDLCKDIVKRLEFAKQRINHINRKKLSFLSPFFNMNIEQKCSSDSFAEKDSYVLSELSLNSGEKMRVKSNTSVLTSKSAQNDDILLNVRKFDNLYTELTTRRDFFKVKLEIDNYEQNIKLIIDDIIKQCEYLID